MNSKKVQTKPPVKQLVSAVNRQSSPGKTVVKRLTKRELPVNTPVPVKAPVPIKTTVPVKALVPVKTTVPVKAPVPVKTNVPVKAPVKVVSRQGRKVTTRLVNGENEVLNSTGGDISLKSQPPPATGPNIQNVPVLINQPGNYVIVTPLTYTKSKTAIVITASNVTLDFNYNLTLTDSKAIGVSIENSSNVTLNNINLELLDNKPTNGSKAGIAINVSGSDNVTLNVNEIKGFLNSINVVNSDNVTIQKGSGLGLILGNNLETKTNISIENTYVINLNNLTVENLKTVTGNAGIYLSEVYGISVNNLNLQNSDIWYKQGSSGFFDNINSTINDVNYPYGSFQLGGAGHTDFSVTNVTLSNSNFESAAEGNDNYTPAVIFLARGGDWSLNNNTFSLTRANNLERTTAVIALGYSEDFPTLIGGVISQVSLVEIINNNLNGNATYGILAASDPTFVSNNITISNNSIINALVDNILFQYIIDSKISNNTINGAGADGIHFTQSDNNLINDNFISSNDSNGIHFESNSNSNIYSKNFLSGNGDPQILDEDANTGVNNTEA